MFIFSKRNWGCALARRDYESEKQYFPFFLFFLTFFFKSLLWIFCFCGLMSAETVWEMVGADCCSLWLFWPQQEVKLDMQNAKAGKDKWQKKTSFSSYLLWSAKMSIFNCENMQIHATVIIRLKIRKQLKARITLKERWVNLKINSHL